MDKEEVRLQIGLTFSSYAVLQETIAKYNEQNRQTFVITKSKALKEDQSGYKNLVKNYVRYSCQFGPERPSESRGIRQAK